MDIEKFTGIIVKDLKESLLMQVANALNNHIRILFNPKVEAFKLFDFLVAKSNEDRYLAQIIEIYEDKFDASQNVAKLKLFYKINENDEVVPYDNFTPNKECEIIKINQEEIEDFINQGKETFHFATNAKDLTPLKLQYEFFEKNPLILADKVENSNTISLNLAKKLSEKKPAVIIDSTGIIDFEGAKKIKALKNFKLPLNYSTIDYVFDNCLADSSLEFQAIGSEIINEIKKFAKKQEDSFIPFNTFTKVLLQQYKVTPYPELRLLLARIKKCQMDEIFARSKKDAQVLSKTIEKNNFSIIDLSDVDKNWQKAYLEYIITSLEQEVYLITRINDENFDADLINFIYNKKKNINFVPNVSYNYKKLPSIAKYCKNYILMPSLYQRTDFLDANFALSNLIQNGCIVFGQNTDNFLYVASDIEPQVEEKKQNYRKISLSLVQKKKETLNEAPIPIKKSEEDFKNSKEVIEQLTNLEQEQLKNEQEPEFEAVKKPQEKIKDEFEPLEDKEGLKEPSKEDIEEQKEKDEFEKLTDNTSSDDFDVALENLLLDEDQLNILGEQEPEEVKSDINVMDAELIEFGLDDIKPKENPIAETIKREIIEEELQKKSLEKINNAPIEKIEQPIPIEEKTEPKETEAPLEEPKKAIEPEEIEEIEENKEIPAETAAEEAIVEKAPVEETVEEAIQKEEPKKKKKTKKEEVKPQENVVIQEEQEELKEENVNFSDEELDFFELAKETSLTQQKEQEEAQEEENITIQEEKEEELELVQDDELDLLEVANNSIDNNFNDILNSTSEKEASKEAEFKNNAEIKNPDLPVFTEEKTKQTKEYKPGDKITHDKYGKGVITKIIQHEQRQLLQIEFEESGKKLLDPKVANINPE